MCVCVCVCICMYVYMYVCVCMCARQCGEIKEIRLAHERNGNLKPFAYIEFVQPVCVFVYVYVCMCMCVCVCVYDGV